MFLLLCITFYLESLTSAVSIKKALFLETLENIYIYIYNRFSYFMRYICTKLEKLVLLFEKEKSYQVDSLTGNIRTLALINESNGSSSNNWFASWLKVDGLFLNFEEENDELLICEISWWSGSVEEEDIIESGSIGASCNSSASKPK